MYLSSRVKGVSESITLSLNEKAQQLTEDGQIIYNLTSGQLPIKPPQDFIEKIQQQLNFLKSYQYSPVAGLTDLRKKILNYHASTRKTSVEGLDVIFSNGSKQSIYVALGAILDPGDEVIVLAPYWVSYPEMVKFWGGTPVVVKSNVFDAFSPALEDIAKVITPRTRAIIVNSPNNPAGVHYSEKWMRGLADLLKDFPEMWLLSDEVYSDLSYFDPQPVYFYQTHPQLIERTVVFGSISKALASTGLRLGWTVAPSALVSAMGKIQGQTTSGPSSLVQRALLELDLTQVEDFLAPVKIHLRKAAGLVREKLRDQQLHNLWYQSHAAFYFMIDFSRAPVFERFAQQPGDHSKEICQELLDREGVLLVPGGDFGLQQSARMSLTMEEIPFQEALSRLVKYLKSSS